MHQLLPKPRRMLELQRLPLLQQATPIISQKRTPQRSKLGSHLMPKRRGWKMILPPTPPRTATRRRMQRQERKCKWMHRKARSQRCSSDAPLASGSKRRDVATPFLLEEPADGLSQLIFCLFSFLFLLLCFCAQYSSMHNSTKRLFLAAARHSLTPRKMRARTWRPTKRASPSHPNRSRGRQIPSLPCLAA